VEFHDLYWTAWVFLAFGSLELYAVATNQPRKTFTHYYCRLFALFPEDKPAPGRPGRRYWRARRAFGGLFPFWLLLHMLSMTMGGLF
jgi:hypothetical protein